MSGKALVGGSGSRSAILSLGLLAALAAQPVAAADCPGHPEALGTFRTLVVDPREHPRIGTMQYAETLPLADHEVVLTFDDGPQPRNSNPVLEILAAQCVKATFFIIGRQAREFPEGVRKVRDAGHSIGTHSQNHPLTFHKMSIEQAKQEVDAGIASTVAALGDPTQLAPFFRIPGLLRAEGVEEYLASQGIQTWSADFPADDWRHVSPARVYDLAMKRLEEKGKGILLLHDIHARTVTALPRILQELKARGYRIVHVVPATPDLPATPTEPQQWQLHPPTENVATSNWPKVKSFVFASTETLPAPSQSELGWENGQLMAPVAMLDRARTRAHGIPLPREAPWPRQSPTLQGAETALPVPAQSVFEIQDKGRLMSLAVAPPVRTAPTVVAEAEEEHKGRRSYRGRHPGRGHRAVANARAHGTRHAAHPARRGLKHVVQVKKKRDV